MRRTIVMLMIGCAIPFLVVGCGGGSDGDGVVADGGGGDGGGDSAGPAGGGYAGGDEGDFDEGGGDGEYDSGAGAGGSPGGKAAFASSGGAGIGVDEGDYDEGDYGDDGGAGADPAGGKGGFAGAGPAGGPGGDGDYPGGEGEYGDDDPAGDDGEEFGEDAYDPAGDPGGPGGRGDPAGGFPGAPGGRGGDAATGFPGGRGGDPAGEFGDGDFGDGEDGEGDYDPAGGGVPGGIGPGGGRRAAPPSGFDGAAKVAFQSGRETEAFKYLYAHALSSGEGAANLLTSIQWVKGLKRPSLAVRFGAGVVYKGPGNISDMKPIGTTQQVESRSRRSGRGGGDDDGFGGDGGFGGRPGGPGGGFGDEGDFGGGGGGRSGGLIAKYAGELGTGIVTKFEERVKNGAFGVVLKDAPQSGRGGYQGGDGGIGGGGDDFGGGGPGGFPGGRGGGFPGGEEGFGGEGGFGGDGGSAAGGGTRGMTIVGLGSQQELINKAKKEGLDVLAVFEVTVTKNTRTGLVINDTKVVLFDVAKGEKLHIGKKLNNFKVQNSRKAGKDDGIAKELEKLFTYIDAELTMSPTPDVMTSEIIAKRVTSLVGLKTDNLLPVLTEIRFWHRRNLLDDDGLKKAFSDMLSPEIGEQLATGTEDERKAIVKRWLPAGA